MNEDDIRNQVEKAFYWDRVGLIDNRVFLTEDVYFELICKRKVEFYIVYTNEMGNDNELTFNLNKQQFGWIIEQLQKLHEMMDD